MAHGGPVDRDAARQLLEARERREPALLPMVRWTDAPLAFELHAELWTHTSAVEPLVWSHQTHALHIHMFRWHLWGEREACAALLRGGAFGFASAPAIPYVPLGFDVHEAVGGFRGELRLNGPIVLPPLPEAKPHTIEVRWQAPPALGGNGNVTVQLFIAATLPGGACFEAFL